MSKNDNGWGAFVDCLISEEINEVGIGYVLIAREKSSQSIRCVTFLVDVFCLGIKDCFLDKCSHYEYGFMKERLNAASNLIQIPPSHAKKLLQEAVVYAKGLGFDPHSDFERHFKSLGDVDASACKETFTFGRDGKPLYILGPKDSPTKVARILACLEQKCGPEGYHYLAEL